MNPPGDAHKMPKAGILALVRTAQQVRSPTVTIRYFHSNPPFLSLRRLFYFPVTIVEGQPKHLILIDP